ncbi:MAG: alpha/beta hydrolase fold domain-containing protein [Lachnospiraceae bacterium]
MRQQKRFILNELILNTDPERITIIGDSAGGNLTAAVCPDGKRQRRVYTHDVRF